MKSIFLVLFVLAVAMVDLGSSQCTCNQCTCSYTGAQECVAGPVCPGLNFPPKFRLKGKQSGKCLARDIPNNRYVIRPCGTSSETYSVIPSSQAGWFQLRENTSGSCVYTVNFKDDNDTPVHGVSCESPATHNWKFACDEGNKYIQIAGHVGSRCMYSKGALVADENPIVMWDCVHTMASHGHGLWEVVPVA